MAAKDQFLTTLQDWMENAMHRSIHAFIRRNRESALSLSQVTSMFRLYHHGPCQVNDLADHLGITVAAVSQLLDNLVKASLIQRTEDPSDRRVKLIALTEQGHRTVEESKRARHAWLEDLARQFTIEEKEMLLPALDLLNARTQELHHRSDDLGKFLHGPSSHKTKHQQDSTSTQTTKGKN